MCFLGDEVLDYSDTGNAYVLIIINQHKKINYKLIHNVFEPKLYIGSINLIKLLFTCLYDILY
jgi:hypothetical protein